jgi:hypothetical protein
MLEGIHFAGSVRTPFGSFCGAFAGLSAIGLGKAPVERSGLKPQDVKELLLRSPTVRRAHALRRRTGWLQRWKRHSRREASSRSLCQWIHSKNPGISVGRLSGKA